MTIREPDVALPPGGGCPYCQNQGVLVVSEIVDAQNTLREIPSGLHIEIACPWCQPATGSTPQGAGMTADLLALLERAMLFIEDRDAFEYRYGRPEYPESSISIEAWQEWVVLGPGRAAIAGHKDAHRAGAGDDCPCYREGWQAARQERAL